MEVAPSPDRRYRPTTTATPTSSTSSTTAEPPGTPPIDAPTHIPVRKEPQRDPSLSVPVEIVSEEEMALIEAALTSARSLLSSTLAPALAPCTRPTSPSRLLRLPGPLGSVRWKVSSSSSLVISKNGASVHDVEDGGGWVRPQAPLRKYRSRPVAVTLLTGMEWCEKQTELSLTQGKPEKTEAMKAGSDRHTQLEEEVIKRIKVSTKSYEDYWALNFLNFIVGTNQLKLEGMTRELPVVGFLQDVCVTGIIDEIHLLSIGDISRPLLVDTKTRFKATPPSEAQKRNGRFQMMCYKYLWDSFISDGFSADHFVNYLELDPGSDLCDDVKEFGTSLGYQLKTLADVFGHLREASLSLLYSQEELCLRYELQHDHSLLEEYWFSFEEKWFKNQVQQCVQFLSREREARYVTADERWKCNFCAFAKQCPKIFRTNQQGGAFVV